MPRGDGTGPLGYGPMGRGRGGCFGLGFGINFRRSIGNRLGGTANIPTSLEEQAAYLEEKLQTYVN